MYLSSGWSLWTGVLENNCDLFNYKINKVDWITALFESYSVIQTKDINECTNLQFFFCFIYQMYRMDLWIIKYITRGVVLEGFGWKRRWRLKVRMIRSNPIKSYFTVTGCIIKINI